MSHYKPYPAYKDSGVEWLGWVPEHWEISPLKYLVSGIESGTSVNATDTPAGEGEFGVLKTSCVYSGKFDPAENKAIVPEEYGRAACPLVVGSLIVSRMNTPDLVGAAGLVCQAPNGIFLPDRLWQVSFSGMMPLFAYYWSQSGSYRTQVKMVCTGTSSSMQNLSQDQFKDFVLGVPLENEQQLITAHLDRETARIDALIEKKTRFIELLREKRQALITHAVTKGLDPSAKMKDSSVEWLGAVPEHWGVKPLKLLVKEGSTISYGIVQPGEPLDEGVPFVQTTNMSSGDFEIESLQKTTPEIAAGFPRSRLTGGEVILGVRASIGAAFVVPMQLAGVNLSRGVARIDCSSELSSRFLVAYLSSMAVDGYWQLAKQGSTFNEVSIATVKELLVPVPPSEEQADIEGMLSNATARLDSILNKTERSIDLLKERRSALITAAVTGQIDLREAV